jgi:hypothetical protein
MEALILLILFLLVPLVNYLIERMQRRYAPPAPESRRVPDMGMRRQPAARSAVSGAPPERSQPSSRLVTSQPVRHRGVRRALFRNQRELKRTIIAMTVLGPCRAYDPPD